MFWKQELNFITSLLVLLQFDVARKLQGFQLFPVKFSSYSKKWWEEYFFNKEITEETAQKFY